MSNTDDLTISLDAPMTACWFQAIDDKGNLANSQLSAWLEMNATGKAKTDRKRQNSLKSDYAKTIAPKDTCEMFACAMSIGIPDVSIVRYYACPEDGDFGMDMWRQGVKGGSKTLTIDELPEGMVTRNE